MSSEEERQPGPGNAEPGAPGRPAGGPRPLTDPTVMRALAHPVRTALFELLSALDTLTATQASELLGESPANCAFHLRTLAKYGFAEEAGGGRGRERPWKATDLNISISTEQDDQQAAVAASTLSKFWLEQWIERARQTYGTGTSLPGWERVSGWSRNAPFLTPDETLALSREIDALIRQYEPRKSDPSLRPPGALPVEWSVFHAPMAELAGLTEAQARETAGRQAPSEQAPSEQPAAGPAGQGSARQKRAGQRRTRQGKDA
jgi:hypothetical protein